MQYREWAAWQELKGTLSIGNAYNCRWFWKCLPVTQSLKFTLGHLGNVWAGAYNTIQQFLSLTFKDRTFYDRKKWFDPKEREVRNTCSASYLRIHIVFIWPVKYHHLPLLVNSFLPDGESLTFNHIKCLSQNHFTALCENVHRTGLHQHTVDFQAFRWIWPYKTIIKILYFTFSTSSSKAHCTPSLVLALASMNSMWCLRANFKPSSFDTSRFSYINKVVSIISTCSIQWMLNISTTSITMSYSQETRDAPIYKSNAGL